MVNERRIPGGRTYEEEVREQGKVNKWERWKRNEAEEGLGPKDAGE